MSHYANKPFREDYSPASDDEKPLAEFMNKVGRTLNNLRVQGGQGYIDGQGINIQIPKAKSENQIFKTTLISATDRTIRVKGGNVTYPRISQWTLDDIELTLPDEAGVHTVYVEYDDDNQMEIDQEGNQEANPDNAKTPRIAADRQTNRIFPAEIDNIMLEDRIKQQMMNRKFFHVALVTVAENASGNNVITSIDRRWYGGDIHMDAFGERSFVARIVSAAQTNITYDISEAWWDEEEGEWTSYAHYFGNLYDEYNWNSLYHGKARCLTGETILQAGTPVFVHRTFNPLTKSYENVFSAEALHKDARVLNSDQTFDDETYDGGGGDFDRDIDFYPGGMRFPICARLVRYPGDDKIWQCYRHVTIDQTGRIVKISGESFEELIDISDHAAPPTP